jgi:hypothetical protein
MDYHVWDISLRDSVSKLDRMEADTY